MKKIALAVLLVVLGAGGFYWWRTSRTLTNQQLIQSLPQARAWHVFIDVDGLRRTGVLDLIAGSKSAEDAEYKTFVEQTGLDYRTDLDAVAAAFSEGNSYLVLRGHFTWQKLAAYAQSHGGKCEASLCSMPASRNGYFISFVPLRPAVLAMAVSADQRGVSMIGPQEWRKAPHLPTEPVWISVPSYALSDTNLAAGTHAFLEPLSQAQDVTFAVGAAPKGFQLRLEAVCATPEIAELMTRRLSAATDLLRKMLDREHMKANPNDLSGVLTSGTFSQQNERVMGNWPIERGFIESLANGKVQ
ncbi:MAG TPA: hypothetical protein VK752_05480 [Bryobacteraceae bacterium]|nr:hypothetical protein [Bryobacteraceae bacterium]